MDITEFDLKQHAGSLRKLPLKNSTTRFAKITAAKTLKIITVFCHTLNILKFRPLSDIFKQVQHVANAQKVIPRLMGIAISDNTIEI